MKRSEVICVDYGFHEEKYLVHLTYLPHSQIKILQSSELTHSSQFKDIIIGISYSI